MRMVKRSVVVICEGKTEWHYIDSLRVHKRYRFTLKPSLAKHTDVHAIQKKVENALKTAGKSDYVICLMDADRLGQYEKENEKYERMIRKLRKRKNFIPIRTYPCLEFWFLLHFSPGGKLYYNSDSVVKDLQAYIPDYEKTDEYLSKNNLYRLLEDRLPQAMERAKRLCNIPEDERICYSEVFKLLELLETLGAAEGQPPE
ncbi:MAG: RloB family protein [Bacteroides sp.]|jgi:hypothetical protein